MIIDKEFKNVQLIRTNASSADLGTYNLLKLWFRNQEIIFFFY